MREGGTDYSHTFCPGPQNGLGYRKLGQLIGFKATLTVAFLRDLHAASLTLLPALQELCAGVHQAFRLLSPGGCVKNTTAQPDSGLYFTSLPAVCDLNTLFPQNHSLLRTGEERSGTQLRESLDSALLPGVGAQPVSTRTQKEPLHRMGWGTLKPVLHPFSIPFCRKAIDEGRGDT